MIDKQYGRVNRFYVLFDRGIMVNNATIGEPKLKLFSSRLRVQRLFDIPLYSLPWHSTDVDFHDKTSLRDEFLLSEEPLLTVCQKISNEVDACRSSVANTTSCIGDRLSV